MKKKVFLGFAFFILVISIGFPNFVVAQIKPGERIVLGVPTAMGGLAGRDGWLAVQMAVEEINAKGGISIGPTKHLLEAYSIDTREHEAGIPVHEALTAVEKLILEKKLHAIVVGAFRSEVLVASMDLISKYKIPYICGIAMTPVYQKKILENYDAYKYCFRNCINSPYLVMYFQDVMKYLRKEFGFNKAYIMMQDVLWAKATGQGMEKWFKENDWEVVGSDAFPTGSTDFSPALMKAKAQKAQVIFPAFDMHQSSIMIKQARGMKVPALIAGFIEPAIPGNAWDVFEKQVKGMVNFSLEIGSIPVKIVPNSMIFHENFVKRWGKEAMLKTSGHGLGPGYDAVYILAQAIERAKTIDSDAVVSALEKTDFSGVTGRVRFGKDHQAVFGSDPKEGCLGVAFQWRKPGVRVPVFPQVIAEGKIQLPPYMKK